MECSWCGKEYEEGHKGYCSEHCYEKDWFDRPRTIGRFYDESPDSVYDNVANGGPYDARRER